MLQIHTKPCPGAGVVIAQSWGAHDPEAVDRQVHTALVLSMGLASLLFILYLQARRLAETLQGNEGTGVNITADLFVRSAQFVEKALFWVEM